MRHCDGVPTLLLIAASMTAPLVDLGLPGLAPLGLASPPAVAAVQEQPTLPASFDVVDSAHGGRFVARIWIGETGQIAIERADQHREQWFADIVADINRQPSILLPAPPPASAPRFAMYGVPIARDDPRFLTAVEQYLSRYHSLGLR
jgi:hypothetical protein